MVSGKMPNIEHLSQSSKESVVFPIQRRNSRWWHLLNSTSRELILRGATRPFAENIIVNEYPKSGGSWFSQMLSTALQIPFPRNRLPRLSTCLMQCHALNPRGMRNVVVVWRDGRDIVVSYYHHLFIGHEFADSDTTKKNCEKIGLNDPSDIRENLPRFIDALMGGEIGPRFGWPAFVDTWNGRQGIVETRYEDLLLNPAQELSRVVYELTSEYPEDAVVKEIVDRFSFKAQSGRSTGTEEQGKFLRKGVAGDWVNYFSEDAIKRFDYHASDALEKLRYK